MNGYIVYDCKGKSITTTATIFKGLGGIILKNKPVILENVYINSIYQESIQLNYMTRNTSSGDVKYSVIISNNNPQQTITINTLTDNVTGGVT